MKNKAKRIAVGFLKIACVLAILGWLFYRAFQDDIFDDLYTRTKRWDFLAISLVLNIFAVLLTLIRWKILVQALGVPLRLFDSLRIGMIGFLFNLSPMGITGGDVVKIWMLSKENGVPGSKALASVFIDRLIGLYVMFVIAVLAVFVTGFRRNTDTVSIIATQISIWCLIVSTIVMLVIMCPWLRGERIRAKIERIPKAGPMIERCINAVTLYRDRKKSILISILLTFGVHSLFCFSIYLIARGVFENAPSLFDHFLLHPVANITSIIPLPAGPYEAVLDKLYLIFQMDNGEFPKPGYGLLVALGYRIETLIVAGIGLFLYIPRRKQIRESEITLRD